MAPQAADGAPSLVDLTTDNITSNVLSINSQSGDARLTYLMERLVTHLHDFARETRLSTNEWLAGLQFLVGCGKISSETRQEFILLSDVLGLSLLVDSINHPKPPLSTQGTVLGPFHTHDAPDMASGDSISTDINGEPLLVLCRVRDAAGSPISHVRIDIWETDSSGHYDVQHANREAPSERCVMHSDAQGNFWFKAIKPVSYPIPTDGPVGQLLHMLKRQSSRPAHMHFMFEKSGWDQLTTALYMRGDKFETSDPVFGVKSSLIVDLDKVDKATAAEYGVKEGSLLLKHDFVLVSQKETEELRDQNATEALKILGLKLKLVDHLPVPDVD
ncbi:hypothetical protein CDD82_7863 [Ophiocordyceps australis]|uniref:Intradiol ring-cleavage dioxygenases domain-containing protein n=1 Tax=Ophiocordyceps australis TaxID=1399860 RepID=A0A2C5XE97_9HYPO|nr:hypothetical protein CDD82_7863 [Ophiocordyceps australis]